MVKFGKSWKILRKILENHKNRRLRKNLENLGKSYENFGNLGKSYKIKEFWEIL